MSIKCESIDYSEGLANSIISKYYVSDNIEQFCLFGENKCFLPSYYKDYVDTIENFQVRDDDVWVVTFPKSGTTWIQEMVWLMCNNLDFFGAKRLLSMRFPYLEQSTLRKSNVYKGVKLVDDVRIDDIANMHSPRFIKTHLHWELLPKQLKTGTVKPKTIYVARNPKDVCVASYHHCVLLLGFSGNLSDFCELFLEDRVINSPFWPHLNEYWKRRNDPNMLFLTYEEMKSDIGAVIKKVANFLNKDLSDGDFKKMCEHLSFESIQKNTAINFEERLTALRQLGLVNDERTHIRKDALITPSSEMRPDIVKRFDDWIEKNTKLYDLPFKY